MPNTTPIIEAIKSGNEQNVRTLLKYPSDFETSFKDENGDTPLHHVSNIEDAASRAKMATLLIRAGIDIEQVNDKGQKPKHYQEFANIQKANTHYINPLADAVFFKPKTTEQKDYVNVMLGIASFSVLALVVSPLAVFTSVIMALGYLQLCIGAKKHDINKRAELITKQVKADFVRTLREGLLTADKLVAFEKQGLNIQTVRMGYGHYYSPLAYAAAFGKVNQLELLLDKNKPFVIDALYHAVNGDRPEAVRFLLSKAEYKNASHKHNVLTNILILAQDWNNPEIIEMIEAAQNPQSAAVDKSARKAKPAVTTALNEKRKQARETAKAKPQTKDLPAKRKLRSHGK